jgi:hypothetical protein
VRAALLCRAGHHFPMSGEWQDLHVLLAPPASCWHPRRNHSKKPNLIEDDEPRLAPGASVAGPHNTFLLQTFNLHVWRETPI